MNPAVGLYRFFARRRKLLAALVLLSLGVSLWSVLNLTLDNSLAALMPDSPARLRRSVELLDQAPFSKVMSVQLTAGTEAAAPGLAPAADAFLEGLDPTLAEPLSLAAPPDVGKIMALMPALCGAACRERLREATTPERIITALESLKRKLNGLGGVEDIFWRLDPLNLRGEVFSLFPEASGLPRPDPLLGYPLSPDGRHLLMLLSPRVSMNDAEGARALMAELDRLRAQLPPGLSAQILGAQRYTAANAEAVERDLALTMSLALGLILAIYLFLVRSRGALWLFLTPIAAMLLAAAGLWAVFPGISGLALGFGAAVLGIAEDYAVHVHYALRRSARAEEALGHIARPLGMSALLCAAGFGVLLFSSVPAIRQLAFFSGLAIALGYVWAIVVLPHCPAMNKPREYTAPALPPSTARDKTRGVWPVFLGLAALAAALSAGLPTGLSVRALGLSRADILEDQRAIEETWRLEGGRRVYLAPGATADEALAKAGQLAGYFNAQQPGSASSLAALLPPPEVQRANLAAWQSFIAAEGAKIQADLATAARASGFAPEAFAPFGDWFTGERRLITPEVLREAGLGPLVDNFYVAVSVPLAVVVTEADNVRVAESAPLAVVVTEADNVRVAESAPLAVVMTEAEAPELPPTLAELAVEVSASAMEKNFSQSLAAEKNLLPACALVSLAVLFWAFRSAGLAALAFIPALGGLVAVLLTQLFLGRPLGLAEAAALPLVICLGADYGIVVVSELRQSVDLGAPRAIFVSGLSTVAGIGILIVAEHPVLHALGRTVFIGLAAAMPIALLGVPRLFSRRCSV